LSYFGDFFSGFGSTRGEMGSIFYSRKGFSFVFSAFFFDFKDYFISFSYSWSAKSLEGFSVFFSV